MKSIAKSASSYAVFFTLFVMIISFPPVLVYGEADWLTGWNKRVKITIDSGDVDTALTDFPILIYLSNSSGINGEDITFVFDEVGINSLKIAVTLSDGTTECYVEIEKWDSVNEQAWLWTKIQSISNITNTEIYLYYDNAHADNNAHVGITNSEVAENVWDSDFLMVQHQAGDSSPILDSTENDIDMTETGNPTYQQAGVIDGEVDYDGDDYHSSAINVFDAIVGTDKGTMELWIKTTASDAVGRVLFSIEGAYVLLLRGGEGGLVKAFWTGTQTDSARTTTIINTGAQFYLASTYDSVNQRVFVAGLQEAIDACNLYDITALNRASAIAAQFDGSSQIDANIDEVRISKIDRSSSWIAVSFETGQDDLIDFGSEETLPTVGAARPEGWVLTVMIAVLAGGLIILGTRRRR